MGLPPTCNLPGFVSKPLARSRMRKARRACLLADGLLARLAQPHVAPVQVANALAGVVTAAGYNDGLHAAASSDDAGMGVEVKLTEAGALEAAPEVVSVGRHKAGPACCNSVCTEALGLERSALAPSSALSDAGWARVRLAQCSTGFRRVASSSQPRSAHALLSHPHICTFRSLRSMRPPSRMAWAWLASSCWSLLSG